MANTLFVSRLLGADVEGVVNDGVSTPTGGSVFGRRFDRVIWDMPAVTQAEGYKPKNGGFFARYWDLDPGGETLKRFAASLDKLLSLEARVLVWNIVVGLDHPAHVSGVDFVKTVFEHAGDLNGPWGRFEAQLIDSYNQPVIESAEEQPVGWYLIKRGSGLNKLETDANISAAKPEGLSPAIIQIKEDSSHATEEAIQNYYNYLMLGGSFAVKEKPGVSPPADSTALAQTAAVQMMSSRPDLKDAEVLLIGFGKDIANFVETLIDLGGQPRIIHLLNIRRNEILEADRALQGLSLDYKQRFPAIDAYCANALYMPATLHGAIDIIIDCGVFDEDFFSEDQLRQAMVQVEAVLKIGGLYITDQDRSEELMPPTMKLVEPGLWIKTDPKGPAPAMAEATAAKSKGAGAGESPAAEPAAVEMPYEWLIEPTAENRATIEKVFTSDEIMKLRRRVKERLFIVCHEGFSDGPMVQWIVNNSARQALKNTTHADLPEGEFLLLGLPPDFGFGQFAKCCDVVSHELYHGVYPLTQDELGMQMMLQILALRIKDAEIIGGVVGFIQDSADLHLIRSMIRGGDIEAAVSETSQYYKSLSEDLEAIKLRGARLDADKRYELALTIAEMYYIAVLPFKLEKKKDLFIIARREFNKIFKKAGYRKNDVMYAELIAERIAKTIPRDAVYPPIEEISGELSALKVIIKGEGPDAKATAKRGQTLLPGIDSLGQTPFDEAERMHEENRNPENMPVIPEKTILCHIITDSILPYEQREKWLNPLEESMRGADYNEKMAYLIKDDSKDFTQQVRETMDRLRKTYEKEYGEDFKNYTVEFDVACPSTELVGKVRDTLGLNALAFEPCDTISFDVAQVEGIMLALRALRSNEIERLRAVYRLLTRSEPETNTNDINQFIRMITFKLPAAKMRNTAEIRELNELISKNIRTAA